MFSTISRYIADYCTLGAVVSVYVTVIGVISAELSWCGERAALSNVRRVCRCSGSTCSRTTVSVSNNEWGDIVGWLAGGR